MLLAKSITMYVVGRPRKNVGLSYCLSNQEGKNKEIWGETFVTVEGFGDMIAFCEFLLQGRVA